MQVSIYYCIWQPFAASIEEMQNAIAAHILTHEGSGQTRIGRLGEHCKTVLQRGLSKGDSEVRRGNEHPTVILIMENFNPFFSNTWNSFETTWRLFWGDSKENFETTLKIIYILFNLTVSLGKTSLGKNVFFRALPE